MEELAQRLMDGGASFEHMALRDDSVSDITALLQRVVRAAQPHQ